MRRLIERTAAALMVVIIALIIVFFIRGGFLNRPSAEVSAEAHYSGQISALTSAQQTLTKLHSVLADQKRTLEERQRALDLLRVEHTALSKVLAVDKAAVEEIFEQQRRRNERDVWKERAVAFVLGVLSGLLTALILHWIRLWRTA
jgi:septal ring factor EnvC (AmiA/AmiB activator)